jgi:hypothetical protein
MIISLPRRATSPLNYATELRAPPFPSINAVAGAKATAFNRWEKQILMQMHLQVPIDELLSQLELYLPIETASAQMKMDIITDEAYKEFL